MKNTYNLSKQIMLVLFITFSFNLLKSQNIIDHSCIDIQSIPTNWIDSAKAKLHIGYGHTSHGSQIISGMNSIDSYHNDDTYNFSTTGGAGILHLFEGSGYNTSGELITDLSHEDDWYPSVQDYLNTHTECNVIMYSWCNIYGHGIQRYLDSLESLIGQYGPGGTEARAATNPVNFIFMTGHSNSGSTNEWTYNANLQIREHCINNDRLLLDFYDIECWDPSGNYFGDASTSNTTYTGAHDLGDDTGYETGSGRGNWGNEWLSANPSHYFTQVQGHCGSCAHSDHSTLQCVLKGAAAWYLWARLAGWEGPVDEPPTVPQNPSATAQSSTEVLLTWDESTDNVGVVGYKIYRNTIEIDSTTDTFYIDSQLSASTLYTYNVSAYDAGYNESAQSDDASTTTLALNTDCNGDVGGTAYLDNCAICVDGNTGLTACTEDCNGDWGGSAFTDNCANCVGGNTGLSACLQDCNGDWGGSAFTDNCANCVGGNTGETACTQDCNGDWGGSAFTDNCTNCVGGNTGEIACTQDCNGDWGGSAYTDNCANCVGGNTGLDACSTSLNQNSKEKLWVIFPNPNNGIFSISGPENIKSINIINNIGQSIYRSNIPDKNCTIQLEKSYFGLCIIEIVTDTDTIYKKILINY